MGGASRNDKRRQEEARARRLAAAGITVPEKNNRTPLIIVAVVVVVVVVVAAVIYFVRSGSTAAPAAASYTASASGAVITAGKGKVVVDVYEDYLCPVCERFEQQDGAAITDALNQGRISVRYHSIAILDPSSEPAGYSTRAANAAICAADAGIFPAYHKKLYDSQPAEGSAGLADSELVKFGTDLGATGEFSGCVTGGTNIKDVAAETDKAIADPALQQNGNFGTPTVAIKGKRVDLNDENWLDDAIAAG